MARCGTSSATASAAARSPSRNARPSQPCGTPHSSIVARVAYAAECRCGVVHAGPVLGYPAGVGCAGDVAGGGGVLASDARLPVVSAGSYGTPIRVEARVVEACVRLQGWASRQATCGGVDSARFG